MGEAKPREAVTAIMAKIIPERMAARIRDLPTLPSVLMPILTAVADPDSSALDISRRLIADQSLSTKVLRVVNSAYFGLSRRIHHVHEAVAILGYKELAQIVLTASVFKCFGPSRSGYDRTQLWRHALAVGIASDRIALGLELDPAEGHYTAGLLHDIGKVALDAVYPRRFAETTRRAVETGASADAAERATFGVDHAVIGRALAEHWRLPQPIVSAIAHHHAPQTAPVSGDIARIVGWADALAYEVGLGAPGNGAPPRIEELDTEPEDAPALTAEHIEEFRHELDQKQDLIDALLGVLAPA